RGREERQPQLRVVQAGVRLDRRDACCPGAQEKPVAEEKEADGDARPSHQATITSTPRARYTSSSVSGDERSVTRCVSSSSGPTTNGAAEPSLSADETATTSAALAIMAFFTYDSSRSLTVIPNSGCTLQTPSTSTSARMARSASTVAAPTVARESFSRRPPTTVTSTVGCSARAIAIGGLLVMTIARRSGGRLRATSSVVVPASRRMTWPEWSSRHVARAIAALAAGACSRRSAYGRAPTAGGRPPP